MEILRKKVTANGITARIGMYAVRNELFDSHDHLLTIRLDTTFGVNNGLQFINHMPELNSLLVFYCQQ